MRGATGAKCLLSEALSVAHIMSTLARLTAATAFGVRKLDCASRFGRTHRYAERAALGAITSCTQGTVPAHVTLLAACALAKCVAASTAFAHAGFTLVALAYHAHASIRRKRHNAVCIVARFTHIQRRQSGVGVKHRGRTCAAAAHWATELARTIRARVTHKDTRSSVTQRTQPVVVSQASVRIAALIRLQGSREDFRIHSQRSQLSARSS
jgi:hypothetical protein